MSIKQHRPKVGEILECDYGQFSHTCHVDGHIPPEMVKKRLVVVLNAKLNGLILVAPISSTINLDGIKNGYHIEIDSELIKATSFYDKRTRWVKSELIQSVSRLRLYHIYDKGTKITQYLPRDVVKKVQKAIVKAINASSLLDK
ncbi:type II toxin-antitoxin system PemK/MazF family toxin [Haemophilus influenzae]|uniref:type II toxin-antitoxin system PemK/MazF family toxin n=1 Tax=Haemophilus influenzae TaxID=727 RepID=UPI0034D9D1F2